MDDVLPNWMTDGKGLRGDAAPSQQPRIEFPSAQIVNEEPQLAQGSTPPPPPAQALPAVIPIPSFLVTSSGNATAGYKLTVDAAGISVLLSDPTDWTSQLAIANTGTPLTWNGADDLVWLEGTGTFPDLTTVAVKSLGNGDSFGAGAIEDGGGATPQQTVWRKVLAAISASGSAPAIQQLVSTNLALELNELTSKNNHNLISAQYAYPA